MTKGRKKRNKIRRHSDQVAPTGWEEGSGAFLKWITILDGRAKISAFVKHLSKKISFSFIISYKLKKVKYLKENFGGTFFIMDIRVLYIGGKNTTIL